MCCEATPGDSRFLERLNKGKNRVIWNAGDAEGGRAMDVRTGVKQNKGPERP